MPISPTLIKRYARSRLYDTSSPGYVTVDKLGDCPGLMTARIDQATVVAIINALAAATMIPLIFEMSI
jgi:polyhydroxyalkanoate synthesis regulator protein